VAVGFIGAVVECRPETDHADGAGLMAPHGVEAGGLLRNPQLPDQLELPGVVFVGVLHGGGDDGSGARLFVVCLVSIHALPGWGFVPGDRVDGGGGDARRTADGGELLHDLLQRGGQGLEAEVGVPETEVELVGHLFQGTGYSVQGTGYSVTGYRVRSTGCGCRCSSQPLRDYPEHLARLFSEFLSPCNLALHRRSPIAAR
jgi:hypothetical protein